MTTPESVAGAILLAVLAGSLLGSIRSFVSGGPVPAPDRGGAPAARPTNWPRYQNSAAMRTYQVGQTDSEPRRRGFRLMPVVITFALGFAVSSIVLFSYNSPWSVSTDLRHLAAGLHCQIARQVDLAPASQGAPGYHLQTDPDGNGISCETARVDLALTTLPQPLQPQSALIWPTDLIRSR